MIAAQFDQFIGGAIEVAGLPLRWKIMPFYSGATVCWLGVPTSFNEFRILDLESEITTFATCHGLFVNFARR